MANDQIRYQVFVSSTFLDLREERQAVTAALLECDAFPAGMELFPAADDDAWTLITKVIDESDYYLLVLGGKYGSVEPTEGISYTEMEFDYAVSQRKPVMAFLHGDPGKIPAELTERREELQEKLDAFRNKVESTKHVKFWTSPEGLAGQVALSFNKFTRLYAATGWIRADQGTNAETLQALTQAQSRVGELEALVGRSRTEPPSGIEDLARGDDLHELPLLLAGRYRVLGTSKRITFSEWIRVKASWDELFAAIGPRLLNEGEEEHLRQAYEEWARQRYWQDVNAEFASSATEKGEDPGEDLGNIAIEQRDIRLDDEELGTLLVQLKALGLITRSERKRSVNDTGTYWTLTPFGEAETVKLRAIRRRAPETVSDQRDPAQGPLG